MGKPDYAHAYLYGYAEHDRSVNVSIMHQYPNVQALNKDTSLAEVDPFRRTIVGIRVIGLWDEIENCRNLYMMMDMRADDNWKVVSSWSDRGQFIQYVSEQIKGVFKSPPPYRHYPYAEEFAVMMIRGIFFNPHHMWCRQINVKAPLWNPDYPWFASRESEPQTVTAARPAIDSPEIQIMNGLVEGEISPVPIECRLCGNNIGTHLSGSSAKKRVSTALCHECYGRLDSNLRKIRRTTPT